jgi:predicted RNase H-like HicB family nuclease
MLKASARSWKSVSPMSGRTFHVVVEKDEDGFFVGEVPELPGCHSQARTLVELRPRMIEAIEAYLEANPARLQGPSFVEVQTIEV